MKLELSPAQRATLANLFFHKDLKIAGIEAQRRFNRARLALRLGDLMAVMMAQRPLNPDLANDHETRHAYELGDETVDFLCERIAALDLLGFQAVALADVFDALERYRVHKIAPETTAPALEGREAWAADEAAADEAPATNGARPAGAGGVA